MEEIKVGEYGRTNLGNIIKFAWYQEDGVTCKNKVVLVDEMLKSSRPFYYFEKNELIKKHSKNIIDLIEENDAIKFWYEKERICNVYKTSNGNLCVWNGFEDVPIKHIQIKSIVTKEQFANAEYRLED